MIGMLLVILLTGSPQGLDAPVTTTPTVRSEIRRGYLAGETCASATAPPEYLRSCFDRIRDRARESAPDSKAFELGLNIRKSRTATNIMRALAGMKQTSTTQAWRQIAELASIESGDAINGSIAALSITRSDADKAADGGSTYNDPLSRGRPHPN